MSHSHIQIQSPVGILTLVASPKALRAILWEKEPQGRVKVEWGHENAEHPLLKAAREQLNAYFEGKRRQFELPLDPIGTPFQHEAWMALAQIPFGHTLSYSELAQRLGKPKAARAVGAAIGKNPLSIVLPCHRVIGAKGQLTGFAGGLNVKAQLLAMESSL